MIHKIITNQIELSLTAKPYPMPPEAHTIDTVSLIADLRDTAQENRPRCLGLAANQIGANFQAFVVISKDRSGFNAFVNPKIVARSEQISSGIETCMSRLTRDPITVRRCKWIKLKYTDPDSGKTVISKFKGLEARIIQHNIDHLKGLNI